MPGPLKRIKPGDRQLSASGYNEVVDAVSKLRRRSVMRPMTELPLLLQTQEAIVAGATGDCKLCYWDGAAFVTYGVTFTARNLGPADAQNGDEAPLLQNEKQTPEFMVWAKAGIGTGKAILDIGDMKFSVRDANHLGSDGATWKLCDGTTYNKADYATLSALLAALTPTYPWGSAALTFNVPDYADRVVIMPGETFTLGDTGGAWTHTHAVGTLAAATEDTHTHAVLDETGDETTGSMDNLSTHTHDVAIEADYNNVVWCDTNGDGTQSEVSTKEHNHGGGATSGQPSSTEHDHEIDVTTDAGSKHTHTLSGDTASADHTPAYGTGVWFIRML